MNFLKSVAQKAKSVTESPTRSSLDGDPNSQQEGFICPLCIESFTNPDLLQAHYETKHSEGEHQIVNEPSPNQGRSRFGSLGLVGQGTGDDRISVRSGGVGDSEELLANQMRALEESKSLLSSEVVSLRKQLAQKSQQENGGVASSRVLERANELAAENVGLKAAIDEVTGQREAAEERLRMLEEKQKQRNTVDDAAVLRQELVNVQKAMDESIKEKEKELVKLRQTHEELFYEKQQMVDSNSKKDKELIETQRELKKVLENNNELTMSKEDQEISYILKQEIHILKEEVDGFKKKKEDNSKLIAEKDDNLLAITSALETKKGELEDFFTTNKVLSADLAKSEQQFSKTRQELDKLQETNNTLKKEEGKLKEEVKETQEKLKSLQTELVEEGVKKDKLISENNKKDLIIENTQRLVEDKIRENSKLEAEVESKVTDVERLLKEKEELLAKIEAGEGTNTVIQQMSSENILLQEKLQTSADNFNDKEKQLLARTESLNQEMSSLKMQLSTEKDQNVTLTKRLKEFEGANHTLEQNITTLKKELQNSNDKADKMELQNKETIREMSNELDGTKNDLKAETSRSETVLKELEKSKKTLKSLSNDLKSQSVEKDALEKSLEELQQSNHILKEDLLNEKNAIEKLTNSLRSANETEINFELKVKSLEDKCKMDSETVEALKQAKAALQEDKLRLETDLEQQVSNCKELSLNLSMKDSRISTLEAGLGDTEVKVREMQNAIEKATGKELSLLSDIEDREKTIIAIEEEKSGIVSNLESQQTILERLRGEKDQAEKEGRRMKVELGVMEEKVCQLQASTERERGQVQEEMEQLKTARELLLSQVVDLKNEKEGMENTIKEVNQKNTVIKEELQKNIKESEDAITDLKDELAGEKKSNLSHQEKSSADLSEMRVRLGERETSLSRLQEEVTTVEGRLGQVEGERDSSLSKVLELEAAVGSASEERRGLLERCVAAEAETERSRGITTELRRKLDDGQAALHELGRENQSIQVELAKQSGRKWKDDTDVNQCGGCQSAFSLTVRKHHCRNCGNIFCNDCSSKQANMSGYKKPQRVCDSCFGELGSA